jgi:hypothetical protein
MRLRVQFPDGGLVADVRAQPSCPFAKNPESGSFVVGSFLPGPEFPRLQARLDAFLGVYGSGDLARASALHEAIDELGLRAVDSLGRTYRVWNVNFQEGGLLFNAEPA